MAQSIMDYVFRRLALDYLDFDEKRSRGNVLGGSRPLRVAPTRRPSC